MPRHRRLGKGRTQNPKSNLVAALLTEEEEVVPENGTGLFICDFAGVKWWTVDVDPSNQNKVEKKREKSLVC